MGSDMVLFDGPDWYKTCLLDSGEWDDPVPLLQCPNEDSQSASTNQIVCHWTVPVHVQGFGWRQPEHCYRVTCDHPLDDTFYSHTTPLGI